MPKTAPKPKKKTVKKAPAKKAPPKKVVKKAAPKPKKKPAKAFGSPAGAVTRVTPEPYKWELPRFEGAGPHVVAHRTDVEIFQSLAAGAQTTAKALADAQNRVTLLPLSGDEVSLLLGKLGRAPGAVTLTEREGVCLAELVVHANRAALMLPGHSDKEVSVHALVTMLLNAGNLLAEAALRAEPAPEPRSVTVTESSP